MSVRSIHAALLVGFAMGAGHAQAEPKVDVVPRGDFELVPLNPLRGDASPKAGVLWGDLREDVPTGALIQFAPGFSSPPHIHNITYRAIVVEGSVHNDDPDAASMWMGPGSFWVQPAGEVHVTAAGPEGATAFLEILSGPYLVQPSDLAFDNGERPINVDERNVVWLDSSDVVWVEHGGAGGPEMAFLWGDLEEGLPNGAFVRLPAEYSGALETGGAELKAVLIKGRLTHDAGDASAAKTLDAGSYFGSEDEMTHNLACAAGSECVLYVRADGRYQVVDAE